MKCLNVAKKLLLIRHAEPRDVPRNTFLGHTDVALSDFGCKQAESLLDLVREYEPKVCYCSPLLRARQTAERLANHIEMDIQFDDRLMEINFGAWELSNFESVSKASPELVDRWADYDLEFSFPEGESFGGFNGRIREALVQITNDLNDVVMVVTHGGVIRGMICTLLGLKPRDYLLFHVDYASCAVVDVYGEKGVLSGLNLTSNRKGV